MKDTIKDIPFKKIKSFVDVMKKRLFMVEWGKRPHIIVSATPAELEDWFRNAKHAEGMLQSYYYQDQVMDLRIPWGTDDSGDQLEFHTRAKKVGRGLEVIAHLEKSRYEHKEDHIDEVGYSVEKGMVILKDVLENSPFDVKEVETYGEFEL